MKFDKDFLEEIRKVRYNNNKLEFLRRELGKRDGTYFFIFNHCYRIGYNRINFKGTLINILIYENKKDDLWNENYRKLNMKQLYFFGKL